MTAKKKPRIVINLEGAPPESKRAFRAYFEEHDRVSRTFDGRVRDLERACKASLAPPGETPKEESPEWFALRILWKIREVRRLLKEGKADQAASAATIVGALSWQGGPEVRKWVKLVSGLQENRKKANAGRAFVAANNRDELLAFVDEFRERHPGCSRAAVARGVWDEVPFPLKKSARVIDYERAGEHAKAKALFTGAMGKRIGRAKENRTRK